jgi:phospholipid/cholesterol/gamma-HCH transport system substrate-binding protein
VKVVNNLSTFTHTLSSSDSKVRELTTDLASVTGELDAERGDLAAAMRNLATALGDVAQLVKDNRTTITSDVQGLASITQTILKQRNSLIETLDDAPLAVENLYNAYDPESESLRTKGDFEQITDPELLICGLAVTFTGDDNACAKIPPFPKLALSGLMGGSK